jgi:putative ABC transport system ATP-binding protein
MGPSGCGKSTLLSLLAGLDRPTEGEVWLGARRLSELPDPELSRLRRRRLGFVFQTFNLIPVLSLLDNVGLPFILEGEPRSRWERRAREALERVGLGHRLPHLPEHVSVGERQRAAIARALVTDPEVLFADEPTGSLDSQRGQDVMELLTAARREAGLSVVLVTHDSALARTADRIISLKDGAVQAERGPSTPPVLTGGRKPEVEGLGANGERSR